MSSKNITKYLHVVSVIIIGLIIIGLILFFVVSKVNQPQVIEGTIGSIAYNVNPEGDYKVYINENDRYVPYIVMDNNYKGLGTLLLRERVYSGQAGYIYDYDGTLIYDDQKYMESNVKYDETTVDRFLNTELINYYDDELIRLMIGNTLYFENYKVDRKLFILPLDAIKSFSTWCIEQCDDRLDYFKNNSASSANERGVESVYWTSSYCDNNWCAIGKDGNLLSNIGTNARYGIRPAFIISSNTPIFKTYVPYTDESYVEVNAIKY